MLALTKRTDYALIALSHLAQHANQVATARAVAERYHVPLSLLMNVLKQLAQSGMVRSVRGSKGGYVLAVAPEEISLHRLIEALEGPVRFVQCVGDESESRQAACELLEHCPLSRPARRVHERLERFLKDVTLADLTAETCACVSESNFNAATVPLRTVATEL